MYYFIFLVIRNISSCVVQHTNLGLEDEHYNRRPGLLAELLLDGCEERQNYRGGSTRDETHRAGWNNACADVRSDSSLVSYHVKITPAKVFQTIIVILC